MVCAKSLEVFRTRGVRVLAGEDRLVTEPVLGSGRLFAQVVAPSRKPPSDLGDDVAPLVPMLGPPHAPRFWTSLRGTSGVLGEAWPPFCGPTAIKKSPWSSDVIPSGSTRVALGGGGVAGWDGDRGDWEALSSCNRNGGVLGLSWDAEGIASVGRNEVPRIAGSGRRS